MSGLAEPHAGVLVDRFVTGNRAKELRERARHLPQLTLDEREAADFELIATGAASPLAGFLGRRDYASVLQKLTLADGTPWPVPFTLALSIFQRAAVAEHEAAALRDAEGQLRGIIEVTDAFVRDAREEAVALYGTDDPAHPGVAYLLGRPTELIGGPISALAVPAASGRSRACAPREVRALARERRWSGLAGLATAQGMGCLEPLGSTKRALFSVPPVAIRHSPGRDVVLQAIVLKNHGAREVFLEYERGDWLGVSQRISPEDLGLKPIWTVTGKEREA